jgi:hypothetical protein
MIIHQRRFISTSDRESSSDMLGVENYPMK